MPQFSFYEAFNLNTCNKTMLSQQDILMYFPKKMYNSS